MVKKEVRHPERDLAILVILVAVVFAGISFVKNFPVTGFATAAQPAIDSAVSTCKAMPLLTYTLLLLLSIVLITYLLRRHVIGHVLHTAWAYALYAMLFLTALCALLEYLVCDKVPYPVIFAIAAFIAVFILDILLTLLAQHPEMIAHKAGKEISEVEELRKIVKSFKKK